MRKVVFIVILFLSRTILLAQPEERDGGVIINYFSILGKHYSYRECLASGMHIQHYIVDQHGNQENKALPLFNPDEFNLPGLIPSSYAYFLPSQINNKPESAQRLICFIGMDTMVLDFYNMPLTARYEILNIYEIAFMPGKFSINCGSNGLVSGITAADYAEAYTALRTGLKSTTYSLLERVGIITYEQPIEKQKRQAYIQSAISIEQSDNYTVDVIFNGAFKYTGTDVLLYHIQQERNGVWENTVYSTYYQPERCKVTFVENHVLSIAQGVSFYPTTVLNNGKYRMVAYDRNGDSVISVPFFIGNIPFAVDSCMHVLHPKGYGYPSFSLSQESVISIKTAQCPILKGDTIHYQFDYFIDLCQLCLNREDLEIIIGRQQGESLLTSLSRSKLIINGAEFTGTAAFTFDLMVATVENGGKWTKNTITILNEYKDGELVSNNEY